VLWVNFPAELAPESYFTVRLALSQSQWGRRSRFEPANLWVFFLYMAVWLWYKARRCRDVLAAVIIN
jgi:hypothetical protein